MKKGGEIGSQSGPGLETGTAKLGQILFNAHLYLFDRFEVIIKLENVFFHCNCNRKCSAPNEVAVTRMSKAFYKATGYNEHISTHSPTSFFDLQITTWQIISAGF